MAKLYSSEVAGEVTDMAVQIHGGYGLMEEYDVERFWRDHRLLRIGEGTSEIQRLIISRQIGCPVRCNQNVVCPHCCAALFKRGCESS
jgi:alkylation response protein AidB-like acyl-CoA dehydrogenase